METNGYQTMQDTWNLNRREFVKIGGAVGAGILLGTPAVFGQDTTKATPPPAKPQTNVGDALKIPRTASSLPGPFPGKVVEVQDPKALVGDKPAPEIIDAMFQKGMQRLTGKNPEESFKLLFTRDDVIGIKVNPVGSGLISTRLEVVDAIIKWLEANGVKRGNIIIWDRFDYMLADAGFTKERYPGIGLEGLQTMDEAAAEGKSQDDSRWLDKNGKHVSVGNFDQEVYYWADVEGPKDKPYLNQHVVNDKHSYFGKLVTKKLTKIINVPVFKNTGNGVSMATKNLGYGAICNTGRLHQPLFFNVCTEVLAFPAIRDKLVLNVTDGIRGQYDGGPMPAAQFVYPYATLFFATDPFALDFVCHNLMVEKRKSMKVSVNENPRFTEYLRYAQTLGLGIADPKKIEHVRV